MKWRSQMSPGTEPFTAQDANSVIQICRSAPLQNMASAEAVNALLARFAEWANSVLAPPAPHPPTAPIMDATRTPTRSAMITAVIAVDPRATDEELAAIGRVR